MADQLDKQTPIFSSYKGKNEFTYWFLLKDKGVTVTPEIQAGLKEFVKNALQHFRKYMRIPKLRCELLGYRLLDLMLFIFFDFTETPVGRKICFG